MRNVVVSPIARWFNSPVSTILLNSRSGKYYWLNHTGTAIWLALVGNATLSEVKTVLIEQYGLSEETASLDLKETIDLLLRRGLVELIENEGAPRARDDQ